MRAQGAKVAADISKTRPRPAQVEIDYSTASVECFIGEKVMRASDRRLQTGTRRERLRMLTKVFPVSLLPCALCQHIHRRGKLCLTIG
jgi:hypothetical protein